MAAFLVGAMADFLPPPLPPNRPPSPPPLAPATPPTSTPAVFSLVFGVLSFVIPILSLPAIICGHVSRFKIKRADGRVGGAGAGLTGLCLGYFTLLLYGTLIFFFLKLAGHFGALAKAAEFDVRKVALPVFPELPAWQAIEESKVRAAQVDFALVNRATPALPGSQMKVRVYLPPGEHAAHSLSCVLVSPAGTTMLTGNGLDALGEDTYHDEALPYAEAGMAVIEYSLDGERDESDPKVVEAFKKGYLAFRATGGGIVNGRNALEFALQRLPMVDPQRVFSAGHSSAGTVSLLLAASEPRLRGCIAYAPGADVEEHSRKIFQNPLLSLALPGVRSFAHQASPMNQTERIKMPVFLFHAKDDSKVPEATMQRFVDKLKQTNPAVTFISVEKGDHYQPMIDKGIPAAIDWIHTIEGAPSSAPK